MGVAEQQFGFTAVVRCQRDADTQVNHDLLPGQRLSDSYRLRDLFSQLTGIVGSFYVSQNDGKLIASDPRNRIGSGNAAPEALGDPRQNHVADAITERVVDRLEIVDTEEQHRQPVSIIGPLGYYRRRPDVTRSRSTYYVSCYLPKMAFLDGSTSLRRESSNEGSRHWHRTDMTSGLNDAGSGW
jgi:hypothetical protein